MEKKCKVCGKMLPLDNFYKSASGKDGYEARCKECRSKHYAIKPYSEVPGVKKCIQCGKILTLECFYKNQTCKDGYFGTCKQCISKNNFDKKEKTLDHIPMELFFDTEKILDRLNKEDPSALKVVQCMCDNMDSNNYALITQPEIIVYTGCTKWEVRIALKILYYTKLISKITGMQSKYIVNEKIADMWRKGHKFF